MINGLVTDPTLSNIFKRVGNTVSDSSNLSSRPIGIVGKNYNFLKNSLTRNIGNSIFDYDGYGTPVSMLAEPELTSEYIPWFLMDEGKRKYDNYVRYINDTYYQGFMTAPNFMTQEEKTATFDRVSLFLINNQVGAVRGYNLYWTPSKDVNAEQNTPTNPNGWIDTQLGRVNNFYLNATLKNAMFHKHQHDAEITNWAYGLFGFDGIKGITDWNMFNGSNQALPQSILTDELIPYSTVTHGYGENEEETPFGVFYDRIGHSQGLIDASSDRTKSYIAKSMYGYDLLSDLNVTFEEGIDYDHTVNTKKKYYASPNGGHDYISQMIDGGIGFFYNADSDKEIIGYRLVGVGNSQSASRTIFTYAEAEYRRGESSYNVTSTKTSNEGINYGKYHPYHTIISSSNKKDIISYTNKKFINGKYGTLIGRFHTEKQEEGDILSSAISHQYGMSHGRNLLKKNHADSNTNGYSDPYCRVWTFHKQYHRLIDAIRPFVEESEDGQSAKVQDLANTELTSLQPNRIKLTENGVKFKDSGLVRCAPTSKDDIKKCMFSIENLAWKNEINMMSGYEKGQKGPLGGRIMWFPPYGLRFSESVQVGWNPTQFIGRGENIYTYTNTERSGSLSFKLLIDHPSIINTWGDDGKDGNVDEVDSAEQKLLRFFAGCEPLGPPIEKPEKPKPLPKLPEIELEPIEVPQSKPLQINFYVFFPNNYSGIDDKADGVVKPVEYLTCGIGAQKYVSTSLGEDQSSYNADNTLAKDFPTTFDQDILGYEMREDISKGISNTNFGNIGGEKNNKLVSIGGGYYYAPIRSKNKNGGINYWGYRVDKQYENQVLKLGNYQDKTSYGLNSEKGYWKLLDYHTDANDLFEEGTLYSFATVMHGIDPSFRQHELLYSDYFNAEESNAIAELVDTYKPVSVTVHGFASEHGYIPSNQKLSDNRAHTIMDWLHYCNPNKFSKDLLKLGNVVIGPDIATKNISDLEAKVWRCSKVTIDFIVDDLSANGDPTKSSETVNDTIAQEAIETNVNTREKEASDISTELHTTTKDTTVEGYNDEYKFFSELAVNMPFLHDKIKDKIKYFDPAYHSITPEGFNARLTFLQQCTRQGSTSSSSDIYSSSRNASNLSYGTPPICVLRLGDFYNTKILIESMQISFEDANWDLNDEGIGVMPMLADITIGFKFLGGSDLSGPISRLQNAVSFNYYANTSVYDQRSESVTYDDNGNLMNIDKKQ